MATERAWPVIYNCFKTILTSGLDVVNAPLQESPLFVDVADQAANVANGSFNIVQLGVAGIGMEINGKHLYKENVRVSIGFMPNPNADASTPVDANNAFNDAETVIEALLYPAAVQQQGVLLITFTGSHSRFLDSSKSQLVIDLNFHVQVYLAVAYAPA
jgi:hypothetical protein